MRLLLSIFILFTLSDVSGQEKERQNKTKELNEHHELNLLPGSLWFNKGIFIGHALSYRYNFNRRSGLAIETNGTVLKNLDHRSKYPTNEKVMPLLNESMLVYRKIIFGKGIMKTRNKAIRWMGSIRLGYHFFQHSSVYAEDYWILDSNAANGATHLAAFQSHSILAGLEVKREKHLRIDGRRKLKSDHYLSVDYIGAVSYQMYAYDLNTQGSLNYRSVDNTLELHKSGYRVKYRFTRWIKPTIGINFGLSALWVPFIDYSPNATFSAPRGGERIVPLFLNANLGVCFKFNKRFKL